jgi:hypothetical protein
MSRARKLPMTELVGPNEAVITAFAGGGRPCCSCLEFTTCSHRAAT